MNESRNPFLLRSSEHIESDATFVRSFGPGILDLLKADEGIGTRFFLSAPGGGKTTLLRLFEPGPLLELIRHQSTEGYRDLFVRMRSLGAVDDSAPKVLGVRLSCNRGYVTLADIDLNPARQIRLFFALLDARIILAAFREIAVLKRMRDDDELKRITINPVSSSITVPGLSFPCDGLTMRRWAVQREAAIDSVLDSFSPTECGESGSDGLISVELFNSDALRFEGEPLSQRVLLMLDDVQKLSSLQREKLIAFIHDRRSTVPIWIAERLESLTRNELLDAGSVAGRDSRVDYLERHWRKNVPRLEKHLSAIADRRATLSRAVDVTSFAGRIEEELDPDTWKDQLLAAEAAVASRVRAMAGRNALFGDWAQHCEQFEGSLWNRAVNWRATEVLMERELNRSQSSFDFALDTEILDQKNDSSVRNAAQLFLAKEFNLPYYFGFATLAKLSSANMQQFMGLAAAQFEEIIAASVISPRSVPPLLSAKRQHELLKRASSAMLEDVPRRTVHGADVLQLLSSIISISKDYTYRPTAPNDPGVNGIAISMRDRERLLDVAWLQKHPEHAHCSEVLAAALAQNYLEAEPGYRCKGQTWLVLNLNRLLCVKADLPLGYGKFREQKLDDIVRWLKRTPRKAERSDLL